MAVYINFIINFLTNKLITEWHISTLIKKKNKKKMYQYSIIAK